MELAATDVWIRFQNTWPVAICRLCKLETDCFRPALGSTVEPIVGLVEVDLSWQSENVALPRRQASAHLLLVSSD